MAILLFMRSIFLYSMIVLVLVATQSLYAQTERPLFIGTYTGTGSYGIYIAAFDTAKGTVRIIDSLAADNPSYLAVNAAGNRLYAVTETAGSVPGAVASFFRDEASGKWGKLNDKPVATGGEHPCYISIDSKSRFAMVANYTSGSLSVIPIDMAGALGDPVQVIQQYGSSVNADRQKSPHVHTAIFSPKENWVVIADLGTDMVKAYPFNPKKTNQPLDTTKVILLKASGGAGPRHIAFHPSQNVFYVMGEMSGKVSVHGYSKKRIAWFQSIPSDTLSKQPGSADIHVSPDGRFLYTSNRADANNITVYKIDPNDGRLIPVGQQSTMGKTPRNFVIDPSGRFLLAANQQTNNIVVFSIDQATGMPKPTGFELQLPKPVCLVFSGK